MGCRKYYKFIWITNYKMIVKSLAKLTAPTNFTRPALSALRMGSTHVSFRAFAVDKKKSRDSQRRGARFGKKPEKGDGKDQLERALEQNFSGAEEVLSQDLQAVEAVSKKDDAIKAIENSKFPILKFSESRYHKAAVRELEES